MKSDLPAPAGVSFLGNQREETVTSTEYELHPLCTLFPRLGDEEAARLAEDIKANGLREPITLCGGMILDGGNRYAACITAGVEPQFVEFDGPSIAAFVLSENLHRRHLTPGQQAAIVASIQDWSKAQVAGSNQHTTKAGPATLPDHSLSTVAKRAAQSGASERTQRMADKVARANPDLAKKVAHGEVSLPKAVAQVSGKAEQPTPEPANDDGPTLAELVDELQAENTRLTAEITALAESDDQKAETLKWHRMYEHAMRRQSEAERSAASHQKDAKRLANQVRECCKALCLADPRQLVPTVKKLAARQEVA